jgi:hypothetical protein
MRVGNLQGSIYPCDFSISHASLWVGSIGLKIRFESSKGRRHAELFTLYARTVFDTRNAQIRPSARSGSSVTTGVGSLSSHGVMVRERDSSHAVRGGMSGGAGLFLCGGGGGGGATGHVGVWVLFLMDGSKVTRRNAGETVRRRRIRRKV